jgi:hypothetical protein
VHEAISAVHSEIIWDLSPLWAGLWDVIRAIDLVTAGGGQAGTRSISPAFVIAIALRLSVAANPDSSILVGDP